MKLAMVGDIALFGRHRVDNAGSEEFFSEIAEYLAGFDLVVGNLETPFTDASRGAPGKSVYIQSDPENVELLNRLNISAVSLANNHVLDFGRAGLDQTIDALQRAGIAHFGIRGKTHDVSCGRQKVRLIGMCSYDTNPLGVISGVVDEFSIAGAERQILAAEGEDALPILSVHFGTEHRSYPLARHQAAFRHLAKRHRFLLHGHHTHALQPAEQFGESVLAYSLGNFCFDTVLDPKSGEAFVPLSDINRLGGLLSVEVSGDDVRWHLISLRDDDTRLRVGDPQGSAHVARLLDEFENDPAACARIADGQRARFVASRRARRDFRFWLERLRLRYFRMIAAGQLNTWLDRRKVPF